MRKQINGASEGPYNIIFIICLYGYEKTKKTEEITTGGT